MLSKNRIKEIRSLQLKKNRDLEKLFIAEGKKTVLEMAASRPGDIVDLFATPDFVLAHKAALASLRVTEISPAELESVSLQSTPAGILAVCRYFEEAPAAFDFNAGFAFYLDDVRDPGNFGTIIRLADWFGVSTVFCSPSSCDLYNPKVIQATMGAFLRVNVVYTELTELLETQSITYVYGAVLNGSNLYRQQLQNGLVIIGNEANGISDANLRLVNKPLTIPSSHGNGSESLNAAMAASIIASEFFRQLK